MSKLIPGLLVIVVFCAAQFNGLDAQEVVTGKRSAQPRQEPVIVAHRGLILDAPENTLASFKACLELGIGFELDVQRTSDGHLMCLHDTTIDRTTNGTGTLARMTRYQTVGLDAGSWFSQRFKKQRIPGIDQVFGLIASYPVSSAIYAVDIKLDDQQVEKDLVTLAQEYKILDRLLFIGNTIQDEQIRKRLFAAERSVQMAAVAHDAKELEVSLANPLTTWVYLRYLPTAAEIAKVHAKGKRIFIAGATVSGHQSDNWAHCIKYGIDAILTDYAIELARQIKRSK
ncbi:MAG: hypothetical protein CMJ76_08225 [Planctomycetaceae bacterium]|nr:hypothetical protein [Planctomycetaceae bacterium]